MKKTFQNILPLFTLVCMVVNQPVNAQTEIIVSAGTSHFLGDLGGKQTFGTNDLSDLNFGSTRYMAGLGVRQNFGKRLAVRGSFYYARISASDKYTNNVERHMRNLSFFSPVYGGDALLEWKFGNGSKQLDQYNWFVFAGIGYFKFDPRTKYNGQTVRLQPLGTEGQFFLPGKSPYALHSFSIPFGIGYKFKATKYGYLSFQVDGRKTFTDYLDDVSTQYVDKTALQASNGAVAVALSDRSNPDGRIPGFSDPGAIRGNPNNKDNFFFLSLSYNIVLGNRDHSAGFRKAQRNSHPSVKNRCYSF